MPAPPPFPAFQTPGTPEEVSGHSLVHRELNYAIAVGFRRLSMDIWLPRNADGGPVPLVVWIHGGAFQLGDRRELPPTFAPDSVFRLLNEAGIACATVDYRHALEAPFPAQLHDIKAAVRYLREHADVLGIDPERIGAWGESAGGHLAALLGLTGGRAGPRRRPRRPGAPQRGERRRRLLRRVLADPHAAHGRGRQLHERPLARGGAGRRDRWNPAPCWWATRTIRPCWMPRARSATSPPTRRRSC